MAGASGNQFTPPSYLSPNQQDLLLAALQSQNGNRKNTANGFQNGQFGDGSSFGMNGQFETHALDPMTYTPGTIGMSMGSFDTLDATLNDSPFMHFLDNNDANLDFDVDADGQMIDDLPDDSFDQDGDLHDKRKSPDDDNDDDDDEDEDPKRHEPDGKVAKKPGRKPLTTEPTSVSLIRHVFSNTY